MNFKSYLENEKYRLQAELKKLQSENEKNYHQMEKKIENEIVVFNSLIKSVLDINKEYTSNKKSTDNTSSEVKNEENLINNNQKKEKKNVERQNIDYSQVFSFEDHFPNDTNKFDNNDDDYDGEVNEIEDVDQSEDDNMASDNKKGLEMTKDPHEENHSYSMPRSIPASFGNRSDSSKKKRDEGIDQDENETDKSINLGEKFAQLASSIVLKDGSEVFGDRPNRRIPINNIIKSCFDN